MLTLPTTTIGPIKQGQTRPNWVVTVLRADNTALDLTGATFTGCLFDTRSGLRKTLTAGSYAITDATNGKFTYTVGSSDVDTPGVFVWETTVTISGGTYYVETLLEIRPRYAA